MTLANPVIITYNAHGFTAGTAIRIVTTGSLPLPITAGTTYYVCSGATLLTNSFTVNTTSTCSSGLDTSAGAQSGTHTIGLTTSQKTNVDNIFVNFSKAIAAYERLIVSKNSAFDQYANGNEAALSVSQKRGLKVFIGKGNCVRCHSGSNFSDGGFHNLGVPQVGGYSGSNDQGRYDGLTGTTNFISGSNAVYSTATTYNDSYPSNNRVSGVTASSSDIGKFKTPTLRSVSQTPPYFHNGTFNSLWDVVNFYNFAGNAGNFPGTKDTILTTRRMTNEEMEDLVNFLMALDGEDLTNGLKSSTAPSTATW